MFFTVAWSNSEAVGVFYTSLRLLAYADDVSKNVVILRGDAAHRPHFRGEYMINTVHQHTTILPCSLAIFRLRSVFLGNTKPRLIPRPWGGSVGDVLFTVEVSLKSF